jgi:hypothetical protein
MMLCACLALVSSPVSAARRSRLCTPTELTDGSAPSYVPKGRTGRGRGVNIRARQSDGEDTERQKTRLWTSGDVWMNGSLRCTYS